MSTRITVVVMNWILINTRSFTGGNRFVASMSLRNMFESSPNRDQLPASPRLLLAIRFLGGVSTYTLLVSYPAHPLLADNSNYVLSGQPRAGNGPFVELVERAIGTEGIYRCKSCTQISPFLAMTKIDRRTLGRCVPHFSWIGIDPLLMLAFIRRCPDDDSNSPWLSTLVCHSSPDLVHS